MAEDRDLVRGSLDTVSDWRLTRPADVPGQSIGQADYVLIAEVVEVERFEQQASEHVQRLADDLAHLVSSRGSSSCVPSFEIRGRWRAIRPALGVSTWRARDRGRSLSLRVKESGTLAAAAIDRALQMHG